MNSHNQLFVGFHAQTRGERGYDFTLQIAQTWKISRRWGRAYVF